MFPSEEAKTISSAVETYLPELTNWVRENHSDALKSTTGEIPFLDALCAKYSGGNLFKMPSHLHLSVKSQIKKIHQKPYVKLGTKNGPELGDLLFVVSYYYNGKMVSRKAVVHQVKIESPQNSSSWKITGSQRELLSCWPNFSLVSNYGGPYNISPLTKEAGSYYLLRRSQPSSPLHVYTEARNGLGALFDPCGGYGLVCSAPDVSLAIAGLRDNGITTIPRPKPYQDSSITKDQISSWQHPEHMFFAEHIAHTKGELAMTGAFSDLIDDVLKIQDAGGSPSFFVIEVIVGANT